MARIVDVEPYKVKDLWLDLEVMSPVSIAGSYSITVALYDGGEPVQAAGSSGALRVQSAFKVNQLGSASHHLCIHCPFMLICSHHACSCTIVPFTLLCLCCKAH